MSDRNGSRRPLRSYRNDSRLKLAVSPDTDVEPAEAWVARPATGRLVESAVESCDAVMRRVWSFVALTAFWAAAFDFVIGGSDCADATLAPTIDSATNRAAIFITGLLPAPPAQSGSHRSGPRTWTRRAPPLRWRA